MPIAKGFHARGSRANGLRALCLAGLMLAAGTAGAGERLADAEIAATFKGMTLDGIYRDGSFFSETYREDGSIRYHDADAADVGEWSVSRDRFCTFYEAAEGACFRVVRDGANCFTFYADPQEGGPSAADWTSRGWDRDRPATCPTAPEIEL